MDFDEVLREVGSFGLYQKIIICAVLLPAVLPCAFHAYSQLFIAATPKHWCRVPELEPWIQDYAELILNVSVPILEANPTLKYQSCLMYKRNYTDIVRYLEYRTPYELEKDKIWHIDNLINEKTQLCQNGWHYDRSHYPNTVVSEWNLVCGDSYLVTLALVVFGIGGLIGNYIFGYLQDIWGRRPSFYTYLLLEIIACVVSAFAWNFKVWLTLRFMVGLTIPAILASPYVLAIEMVGPEKRVFCTIVSNIAYSCGLILLAGIVYCVRDWRYLTLTVSLPLLLLYSCYFVLPESPRWLMAVNKQRRAVIILKRMAQVNGVHITADYIHNMMNRFKTQHAVNKEVSTSYGLLDLFRTRNMRHKTLIITIIWFANTSVYVGLSYYAPNLGGDEIWNFFLAGVVELPTYILLWPGLNYFGRRWILCLSMLLGGIACVLTSLYSQKANIMLILYCIGKMGISSAFVVLPLLASEIYPTVVRGLGMSFSSVIAMLGPIIIPIVNHMGKEMLVLPLIVMGILLIVGGLLTLFLPETKDKALPETLIDGEAIPLLCFSTCFHHKIKLKEETKLNVIKNSKKSLTQNDPVIICNVCKIQLNKSNQ